MFEGVERPTRGNDRCALQASFTLDTEKFRDISAPNATVANVGAKKQISYTLLPGKGIDTSITAEVENFQMPAVSINGVSMEINIEVDDKELTDKVNEQLEKLAADGTIEKLAKEYGVENTAIKDFSDQSK